MEANVFTINDTSPAAASTVVGDTAIDGNGRTLLVDYDFFMVDADLVGATGGALDVYLQRKLADNVWRDWCHFPQLAAGASAVKYTAVTNTINEITVVGGGTVASPAVALAANEFLGGHPGFAVRAVYVAGASTSAGAVVLVRITGWRGGR